MILLLATLAYAEDLYVSSNIKGAEILLNGVDTGFRTPATLHGVPAGAAEVAVELGCSRGTSTVVVEAGLVTRVSVAATQQLGTLTLSPEPIQAKLILDGAPFPGRAGSPLAVECGSHTVRAELYGFVPAVLTVDVGVSQDLTIPITLSPLGYAVLDLSVHPREATLFVDNVPVGADAVTLPSVFAGGHAVSAELDGYQSVKTQIVMAEGESQAWHFELVRAKKKNKVSTAVQLRGSGGGTTTVGRAAVAPKAAPDEDAGEREVEAVAPPVVATKTAEPKPAPAATTQTATVPAATTRTAAVAPAEPKPAKVVEQPKVATTVEPPKKKDSGGDYYSRLRTEPDPADVVAEALSEEANTEADLDTPEEPAPKKSSAKADKASGKAEKPASTKKDEPKSSKREEPPTDDDHTKHGKTGRTIAGTSIMVLGAGAGGAGVYFYDRTQVAYDAYNAKLTAAKEQEDPALREQANTFYDHTLVPRRNLMYASAGTSVVCLATGLTLVLVDDRLPILAPIPGGAMVRWHLSF